MIVGQDLMAWLADRPRRRDTQAAIDAFADDWNRGAVHRRFDQTIAAIPAPTAEKVADAARALFADDGWVDTLIGSLAARMRDNPFFDPPFRNISTDIHRGLLVYESGTASIAVGAFSATQLAAKKNGPRGATSINFPGQLTVMKFLRAGGARFSFWTAPRAAADFTAAAAGRCVRTGARDIEDGEILVVDGRSQSYVIERLRGSLLLVQASITLDQAPLKVEYDSASGAFVGCSATGDTASRIQMITTLLRKLGCDAALPAMVDLLDHPDFFVRWHVMREMLGLDAAAALPHLKRMAATDPHPDPRRAARLVLDRLEAPAGKRQAA
jgi:hypothetical protein